ncbi:sulfhydryl oxidase 1-like isoform X2, partial [Leptotrombidium deliense]
VLLANCYPQNYDQSSLFNASDPSILVLSKDTIKQTLAQHESSFVVLFYLSWCGHCIRFAPVFKKFAEDVRSWNPVLRIGAINCAEVGIEDFCSREFNVLSFPKVKFFEPTKQRNGGIEFTLRSFESPDEIEEKTLKSLNDYLSRNRIPESWPNVNTIEAFSKSDLLSKLPVKKNLPVLLIIEKSDSLLGLKVILDMTAYGNRVTIFRVNGEAYDLRNTILPESDTLPVLIRVGKQGEIDLLERGISSLPENEIRRKLVATIDRDFLSSDFQRKQKEDIPQRAAQVKKVNKIEGIELNVTPVHYIDLYNAIRYSLYQEIGSHTKLNETQVDVVRRYFQALNDYFPFQNENARRFVKRMTEWFNHQTVVTKDQYFAIMKAGSEGYLPAMQLPWRSCEPSMPNLRGYPCSLWLLFHTLTVSEYTHQHMVKKVIKYHSVLRTMREYVKYFFTCTYCAEHFVNMAANLDQELQYPNSSVVWLWKAHNKVNKRLAGDRTEDPKHPKIQFPSQQQCPKCYTENNEWKESEVVNFLTKRYQKASIVKNGGQNIAFGLLSFMSLITYIL